MTAEQYLKQIRVNDAKMQALWKDVQDLKRWEGMPGIADRVQLHQKKLEEMMQYKQQAIEDINSLPDEKWITVLNLHYVQFRSWDEIGQQMGYNSRYIQQLKLKGLKVLAEMKGFN
jgi:DNA-directed RNA polymerase specialized sigma subunit